MEGENVDIGSNAVWIDQGDGCLRSASPPNLVHSWIFTVVREPFFLSATIGQLLRNTKDFDCFRWFVYLVFIPSLFLKT